MSIESSDAMGAPRPGDRTGERTVFRVRYGQRGALDMGETVDVLGLTGPGTLEVRDDTVVLTAISHRSFRPSRRGEHALERSAVFNVQVDRKVIRFEFESADGGQAHVVLKAAHVADAARIAALLPQARTEAFAVDQRDRADFRQRLDRWSPRAPVTPTLVAINLLVFVLMAMDGSGVLVGNPSVAIRWGSNFAVLTMDGQWWRLFTALFIHFTFLHVALNMWALYLSGRMTERLYGSVRFATIYLFSGLIGSLASLLWNPSVNSAGASSAIFGVFGAMLAFVMNARNGVPRSIMVEHRNSTLAFVVYSLFYGAAHSGIDNASHIGGLLGGFFLGSLLARPLDELHRAFRNPAGVAAAVMAGLSLAAVLAWPLFHPGVGVRNRQAYDRAVLAFASSDQHAAEALRVALSIASAGHRDSLLRPACSAWSELHDTMAAPKLVAADPRAREQALVLGYLDARKRYCELEQQAFVRNDAALERQAQAANRDAEEGFARLKQLDADRLHP